MTTSIPPGAAELFIERLGLLHEEDGLPRIAGRIFGFLLLQPTPCSLDEMAEALRVSKASISTDVRRLLEIGFVERSSRPGDRRDYYMLADDWAVRAMRRKMESMRRFDATIREAHDVATDPVVIRRLEAFETLHRHVVKSMERFIAMLQESSASARPSGGRP